MANSLTTNPLIINAEGIISIKPIWIRMVRVLPAATGDFVTFTYWDENETPDHHFSGETATLSTATFTSTGKFAAGAPAVNDIIYFYKTSTGNNQFRLQTATAGDNNDAVVDALNSYHGTLTDESTKVYSWKIWTPKVAFDFDTTVTPSIRPLTIDFGEKGKRFSNLAVHTIDTNLTAEIFVR